MNITTVCRAEAEAAEQERRKEREEAEKRLAAQEEADTAAAIEASRWVCVVDHPVSPYHYPFASLCILFAALAGRGLCCFRCLEDQI